jgi:hypothetical protein
LSNRGAKENIPSSTNAEFSFCSDHNYNHNSINQGNSVTKQKPNSDLKYEIKITGITTKPRGRV